MQLMARGAPGGVFRDLSPGKIGRIAADKVKPAIGQAVGQPAKVGGQRVDLYGPALRGGPAQQRGARLIQLDCPAGTAVSHIMPPQRDNPAPLPRSQAVQSR